MSIYRYDFTIAATDPLTYAMDTTGPSHSTTYMSDTNLYFKQGDTIQVRHLHPINTLDIKYTGPDIHGADPDPTDTGTVDGNPSTTTVSRTREWDSNYSTDDYTRWFFFAPDANGANVYSSSIIFRKVGYTGFTCGVGTATDGAVIQGQDITFRVATLPGLDTWSSSTPNADRIYLSIRNATSTVLMDPRTYTSGDAWDNSTSELGVFTTADKDTVLTVGSGFPAGTYTVYLTHYNNTTRMNNFDTDVVGNRFHGTAMQFGSVTMVVSTPSGGSGPNPADFSFTDQGPSGITGGTTYGSNTVTLSGMSQASTVTAFTSSDPQTSATAYRIGGAGSWYINVPSPQVAVPANTTIRLKRPASTTAGGTVTMSVTVGTTQSGTWTITTPTEDTEPDAFQSQLTSTPYSSQALNATVTSDLVTMAGTSAGSSSSVSVSGESAAWRSRADSSSSFTVYSSSAGTIPAGHQFQFKFNASDINATETSATIDVGGTTGTIYATTVPGSSGGGAATPNYGLQVLNSDGTALFGNQLRTGNVVKYSTTPVTVPAATRDGQGNITAKGSVQISSVEGMTTGNADEIAVILLPLETAANWGLLDVERGAGLFHVKSISTFNMDFHYTVIRV